MEKVEKVLGNALEVLNTYWHGKLHGGFWVTSEGISTSAENSDNDYTTIQCKKECLTLFWHVFKKMGSCHYYYSGMYSRRWEAAITTILARIQEDGKLPLPLFWHVFKMMGSCHYHYSGTYSRRWGSFPSS